MSLFVITHVFGVNLLVRHMDGHTFDIAVDDDRGVERNSWSMTLEH